ncbi:MAG: hypothetical protein MZV70_17345 [Desulfobacterales bacterium]|nr:hypothetical protein [Desulfobacterales bacterium]
MMRKIYIVQPAASHTSALSDGETILVTTEDVGRHNATRQNCRALLAWKKLTPSHEVCNDHGAHQLRDDAKGDPHGALL